MRVLQIINSLNFGGAEKLLVESVPIYKKKGVEIDILVLNKDKTYFTEVLENEHGVKIIKLGKAKNMYSPINIFKIRKYLKNYDVIHVHLFPSIYWVAIASIFTNKKRKIIVTEHNTENRRRNILIFKYLDRLIYSKFSKIGAISEGVQTNLQKHLGKKFNNIVQINNGINLESIKKAKPYNKSKFGLNQNHKVIIQVSSFTPQKDQETLIKAVALLPNDVHLFLVGDGPLKNKNIEMTRMLKISERVHFLGHRSDVPRLLKTADVSVLSSHYEGFGLVIVEGMAAGNACLGSDVPGLAEIIGKDGIIFPPGDHKELKKILLNLLNDSEFYNEISQKCLIKAETFDINLMVQKYLNLYLESEFA